MRPWLSVLIPTYNGETFLPAALDSIAIQEDPDIECIAVDDGSTDQTLSILEQYKEKLQLVIVKSERKGNWVAGTNHALRLAHGDYICILHQDDIWYKDRLKSVQSLIKAHPRIETFLHAANFIDSRGRSLGHWRCPLPAYPSIVTPEIALEHLLTQNFIAIPAPTVKRDAVIAVGGLDESLWYTADWDFWLKLALRGPTLYSPTPLCGFRVHPNSQTATRSAFLSEFRQQLETVSGRYLNHLNSAQRQQDEIRKTSSFSIEVNIAFAAAVHGQTVNFWNLIIELLQLGPAGIRRYLRDSRILERTTARIKSRLTVRR